MTDHEQSAEGPLETDETSVPKSPDKQELKREVWEFAKLVVWFIILFVTVRSYVVEGYEVQGPSMSPTLTDNERILVLKLPHVLSRFRIFGGLHGVNEGDIVVFKSPDYEPGSGARKRYVKRVIARGSKRRGGKVADAQQTGDSTQNPETVSVKIAEGVVYVNNHPLQEPYVNNSQADPQTLANDEWIVPPGFYYVMGDNRGVSKDSRKFGPVDDDVIIGTAVFRFWPLSKFGFLK